MSLRTRQTVARPGILFAKTPHRRSQERQADSVLSSRRKQVEGDGGREAFPAAPRGFEDRRGGGASLGQERKDLVDGHVSKILIALDDRRLAGLEIELVERGEDLQHLELIVKIVLEPEHNFGKLRRAAIFKSARHSWERFTSAVPLDLFAAAGEDAIGLPFLRAAMRRLCEEYPWTRDGLSRSQRHALYAVAQGPARLEELFSRAQAREEAFFLGQRAFSKILEDLCAGEGALIEDEEGKLVPTALGRRVLAGDADWLDEHPIDRWVGGVHLRPEHLARWDDDAMPLRMSIR